MAEKRGINKKLVTVLIVLLLVVFINASITGEAKYRLRWRGGAPTVQIQSSTSPAPATLIINPIGWHDSISSDCSSTSGWSCDSSDYSKSVFIQILDASQNNKFVGKGYAIIPREAAVGNACGGNSNRGFSISLDNSIKDGKSHSLYAYATNIPQGNQVLLSGTPKTVTCPAPNPCTNGVKDGSETDVDCGGSSCGKCGLGKSCGWNSMNCAVGACLGNQCILCSDTDGGGVNQQTTLGSVTYDAGAGSNTLTDVCADSITLNERVCIGTMQVNCNDPGNGTKMCTNGACV